MIVTGAFSCLQGYVTKLLGEEKTLSTVGSDILHSAICPGRQAVELEDNLAAKMQAYLASRRCKSTGTMSTMSIPAPPYILEGGAIGSDLYWK
jgi:hypothetical protein